MLRKKERKCVVIVPRPYNISKYIPVLKYHTIHTLAWPILILVTQLTDICINIVTKGKFVAPDNAQAL